jgi:hypothetical protein
LIDVRAENIRREKEALESLQDAHNEVAKHFNAITQ